jgi:hypothetical protein
MKNTMLNVAIGAVMIASVAQAVPSFNTVTWSAVTVGGNNYVDGHYEVSDPNYSTPPAPQKLDIVGNLTTAPAAYTAYDGQYMYFRVRIDGTPAAGPGPQNVWSAVLNTDADNTADWVIQWDMTGDNQVELARATAGSPTDVTPWSLLAYNVANQTVSGAVATDWYRYVDTGDSTTFPDIPAGTDYYVDFAFDKSIFDATLTAASETPVNSFSVVFASSAQHQISNKDLPDQGWSDTITVPEPTSMALLALGVTVLAMRRRKV